MTGRNGVSRLQHQLLDWGIGLINRRIDGEACQVMEVTCCRCGHVEEIINTKITPVEMAVKKVRRHGWLIEGKTVLCIECQNNDRREKMANVGGSIQGTKMTSTKQGDNLVKKISDVMKSTADVVPITDVSATDPSVRKRIRDFLDGHFDEQRGCYLDGLNDEKAGEELQIPWAWVKDYREFAYGPIKVNPELVELLEKLTKARESMQADIDALSEKWNAAITTLQGKVNAAIKGK